MFEKVSVLRKPFQAASNYTLLEKGAKPVGSLRGFQQAISERKKQTLINLERSSCLPVLSEPENLFKQRLLYQITWFIGIQ